MATPLDGPIPSGPAQRTFVVPSLKLVYVSLPKNACTSIKQVVAELSGEDPDHLVPTLGFRPTRAAGVHSRKLWQRTPTINDLPAETRAQINPDNGWYVFSVVRDPRVRLFSAWQNKYLLRSPGYWTRFDQPWTPRLPTKASDVLEDFAAFVAALTENPHHEYFEHDGHFRQQVDLLLEDTIPYSHLYDISQMRTMADDLAAHLRAQGHPGEFELDRSNDTPLPANRVVFENGVREAIEKHHADDFARFGEMWDFSRTEAKELTWTEESFQHVHSVVKANERIADLARAARQVQQHDRRMRAKVKRLRSQNAELTRRLRRAKRSAAAPRATLPRRALRRVKARIRGS